MDRLQLELVPAGRSKKERKGSPANPKGRGNQGDDVLTPKPAQNPVLAALQAKGLYKTPLGSGKHDITCHGHMSIPTNWTRVPAPFGSMA
ncbi:hypothetical protein [Nitrosospira sp. Nsp14]|uniref:hypothetical protein n=1 Tax=Nitrosospira sp. Nsp14 TaxID=1855333 RepID=UPI001160C7D2|nr:hypothetical protein [Nitrosospira sp. Nsp14]